MNDIQKDSIKRVLSRLGVRVQKYRYYRFFTDKENYPELARMKKVGEGPVIFDVGGNIGQTAIAFRHEFPNAQIYSFEPFCSIYEQLSANAARFSIHCHRLALGDEPGKRRVLRIHHSPFAVVNSVLNQALETSPDDQVETIQIDTLDRFCRQNNLEKIDILKIDTEGFDLQVLKGGSELLGNGGVLNIIIEVSFNRGDLAHSNFFEVIDCLCPLGFETYSIYDVCHNERGGALYLNVLFKKLIAP